MTSKLDLKNPPIIEAVLDIDCQFKAPIDINKVAITASKSLAKAYPQRRPVFIQNHQVETTPSKKMKYSVEGSVQGFQFLSLDGKQIIQFRTEGFSFNRLAPYSNLNAYLPQIKRAWELYRKFAVPTQIRSVRLRFINRILVPLDQGKVNLDEYIRIGPRTADIDRLDLTGFLEQYVAIDKHSGHQVNSLLTLQPENNDMIAIIFDNGVASFEVQEPNDWPGIRARILELREVKNHVFNNTLTEKCLNLFR
jgi:uncharacterized protein (TIGR04255 family)